MYFKVYVPKEAVRDYCVENGCYGRGQLKAFKKTLDRCSGELSAPDVWEIADDIFRHGSMDRLKDQYGGSDREAIYGIAREILKKSVVDIGGIG